MCRPKYSPPGTPHFTFFAKCGNNNGPIQQIDLHVPVGKHRANLQRPAHGFHVAPERAEVHIGALFQLRNVPLIHLQHLGQPCLRHLPRIAKLIQRHLCKLSLCPGCRTLPCFGRHLRSQFCKLPGHNSSYSFLISRRCCAKIASALGTNSSYQRLFPVLSPPSRRTPVRRGSKA